MVEAPGSEVEVEPLVVDFLFFEWCFAALSLAAVLVLPEPEESGVVAPVWVEVSPAELAPVEDEVLSSAEDGELLVLLLEGDPAVVLLEEPPYWLWANAGVTPRRATTPVARRSLRM